MGLAGSPGVTPVAHSDPKLRARGTDEQQCHAKSVLFLSPVTQIIEAKSNISSKKNHCMALDWRGIFQEKVLRVMSFPLLSFAGVEDENHKSLMKA